MPENKTGSKPINVLFLCTGNSARSILSEALVNDLGKGRFLGWSAGSHPSGAPHPDGLAELEKRGHRTEFYRSKSWDEFAEMETEMNIVITVCGNAANEVCPAFPGRHIKAHWPADDPAHVQPLEARQQAFADIYDLCRNRIEALVALADEDISRANIRAIAKIN
jgi:arsenate reductase